MRLISIWVNAYTSFLVLSSIGLNLKFSGLLLQRVHLAKNFNLLARTFVEVWQCHRRTRHKKKIKPLEIWKIRQCLHMNKEILRARWPIVRGVRGGWKAITALVQLGYPHFKLRVVCDDGRQPRLRPSLDGKRRPFPVRLPYVRSLATGSNGTVTVPVWRTRLSV